MEHRLAIEERLDAHKGEILAFTQDLIEIASENPPGNRYRECMERIRSELNRLGLGHRVVERICCNCR